MLHKKSLLKNRKSRFFRQTDRKTDGQINAKKKEQKKSTNEKVIRQGSRFFPI